MLCVLSFARSALQAWGVARLGAVVLLTFAVLWLPFALRSHSKDGGSVLDVQGLQVRVSSAAVHYSCSGYMHTPCSAFDLSPA